MDVSKASLSHSDDEEDVTVKARVGLASEGEPGHCRLFNVENP